ncbi:hypothetical protein H072_10992 [Dactylellina haptotyla CBS 200.50]|uniref:F-box domain-containing protein n=1 Tax=Dactylellina haptotyla (strain CBS 200.50) TaxID=1284197 RepID=S8A377_DACHA|nr:hypothetical protein H072_10992 [Dactylellina haptotyla CBS 200.50]
MSSIILSADLNTKAPRSRWRRLLPSRFLGSKAKHQDPGGSHPTSAGEDEEQDDIAVFNILPVEIHIQILSYVSWRDQLNCSLAFPAWNDILRTHGQSPSILGVNAGDRYGTTHSLLSHNLIRSYQWELTIKDGQVLDIISLVPVSRGEPGRYSFLTEGKFNIRWNTCHTLNNPIFGDNEPSRDYPDAKHIRTGCGLEVDVDTLSQIFDSSNYWYFEEHPEFSTISIKEFLQRFVVDVVMGHKVVVNTRGICKVVKIKMWEREVSLGLSVRSSTPPSISWLRVTVMEINGKRPSYTKQLRSGSCMDD